MLLLLSLVSLSLVLGEEYTVANYPNPKRGGYEECNMRSASFVCDPYETLSESERYRINSQLVNFITRTEESGSTFCDKKGTEVMFLIHQEASQQFADSLRQKWNMDAQCGKNGFFVLSLNDRKIYGSFDERSPIRVAELMAIIATEDENVKTGAYTTAMTKILKEVAATQFPLTGRPTTVSPKKSGNMVTGLVTAFLTIVLYII